MTVFKLTYAPHRNDHMNGATDEEAQLIKEFIEKHPYCADGRAAVVMENVLLITIVFVLQSIRSS